MELKGVFLVITWKGQTIGGLVLDLGGLLDYLNWISGALVSLRQKDQLNSFETLRRL